MRLDDIAVALARRRDAMQKEIFNNPPQDYEAFLKRLGVWNGLGEALKLIEDARKDNDD